MKARRSRIFLLTIFVLMLLAIGGWLTWQKYQSIDPVSQQSPHTTTPEQQTAVRSTEEPAIETQVLAEGRDRVWDMARLSDNQLLFTERKGTLSLLSGPNNAITQVAKIADVYAAGEGGLMGLAVDPEFTTNRYIYTCYNTSADIRVVRWKLPTTMNALTDRFDVVTGIPRNPSGRHSGCRVAFGPDTNLWITTGDTAQNLRPQSSQDPTSLAGKILRVTRDGKPTAEYPNSKFDPRIYSYGHRNVQGITFFEKPIAGVVGLSAEHGSDVDDEVNLLKSGNFGWAPPDGPYNETGVPMTDKQRFPDAIDAIWKSGSPTQAPSGMTVLKGSVWKAWEGNVLVAILKDKHLKMLQFDDKLQLVKETRLLDGTFGRVRAVVDGPGGSVYVSTDNGSGQDKIIRLYVAAK